MEPVLGLFSPITSGGKTRKFSTEGDILLNYKEMLVKDSTEVKVTPPEKLIEEEKKKTVIYKTFSIKIKIIERMQEEAVEKCFKTR